MNLSSYEKSSYRYDVQGVRAIGALLIMIYHIWIGRVSGGVDVFFVVSGYFMAGMLTRSYLKNERVRPFEFWGRIIRRIAPLAYTVIAFTLILGYFLLPANFWRHDMQGVLASIVHLENWYLIFRNADYLARSDPPSPVQQFWALSLQMQFYLVLPLIFYVGVVLSKVFNSYKALLYFTCTLIVISFSYSLYYTHTNPSAAYFHPGTRAWEFLVGAAIFLVLPFIKSSLKVSRILLCTGFLLILAVGIIVPQNSSYPGSIAVLPVAAASFMIIGGANASSGLVYKLLSSKPLVYIGGLSFAIYLWHWPILIYFQHYFDVAPGEVGYFEGIIIILLAFVLSIVSKKLIEDPIANIRKTNTFASYVIGALCFASVALPSLFIYIKIDRIHDSFKAHEVISNDFYKGRSAYAQNGSPNINLDKFIGNQGDINTPSLDVTSHGLKNGNMLFSESGDRSSDRSILLVGGSTNAHWEPFFSYLGKKHGFKVIVFDRTSCSFGYNPNTPPSENYQACNDWNNKIIETITHMKPQPKIVVVNTSRHQDRKEFTPIGSIKSIKEVLSLGIPVIGIRINPLQQDPNSCLWKSHEASDCAVSFSSSMERINPAIQFKNDKELSGLYLVDFKDVLCTNDICPAAFEGYLTMTDDEHLTYSYIHYLAPALEKSLNTQVQNFMKLIEE